ncbi:GNAT family N-acetyltransferase [Bradyrhizobium sp. SRS-191]|uniref:GNAT family N-acetyltransferase n=1 Tax=Bradyrhizobium sp. SRS-191 TaxID=2962606 RepID=UPI00211EE1FC|nr:GNAT family N-acetyltransferase [Bradyrhizobium sp. SRS-191]
MQDSVRLKSFELFPQDIASVDVELLHALTISVGWPHRPNDLELMRRAGKGIVAVDGIGRVFGSAMWFPHGDDFATVGLVITVPRTQAQGNGRWLMDHVFSQCGARRLSLNATKAAYALYLSLGFTKEAIVQLYDGEVSWSGASLPPVDGRLEQLSAEAIREIMPLDRAAFGVDRERLLTLLAEVSRVCVLRRRGEIVGYSMCREFGRGHVIGPIVSFNDEDVIHLAAVHMEALRGRFVRVDTRSQGVFAEFLTRSGLVAGEAVTTMWKGRPFLNEVAGHPIVYGLAGHSFN